MGFDELSLTNTFEKRNTDSIGVPFFVCKQYLSIMETIILENDIKVICVKAVSFPDGIQDAHDKLRAMFPPIPTRRYFGISYPQQGGIVYRAATGYCLEWYLSDKDVRCMVRLGD